MGAPPARLELALAPTPILRLDRLSRRLGVEVHVKRDDLTGLLESGSKIRKLEFLIGEALQQGADTLITSGVLRSNGPRAVAAVAARLGLRAIVAVRGERPAEYDGELLLERLLGARIQYGAGAETPERLAEEVRAVGGRPYVIPEGGDGEVGALGYLECAVELTEQSQHGAPRFDAVVITSVRGGSHAGLLLGKQLVGLPGEIVSVPVAQPADAVRRHVVDTAAAAIRRYGFAIDVPKAVHVIDGYQSDGEPGVASDPDLEILLAVAREEGLLLDPLYTARGFRALVETLARDRKALGSRVCFVHTGGIYGVFPERGALGRLMDR
jgi:D-cysteine desulfhydrase family pyridoxal phosphate-dependent enzyme